jgi:membrane-associated protease RseP (regulator of RpoE activity)
MTLYAPGAFDEKNRGESIAFEMVKKTPHIRVRIQVAGKDATETDLQVDSGSGDALDSDALAATPVRLEIVGGVGLGQEFRTVMGRAEWMELGSYRLSGPIGASGGVQLIGMEILRRFDVLFDYAKRRIFLKPNRNFAEPFTADASGLDLRWTNDLQSFSVHDVAKDSPASEAGMVAGDVIVAINNLPASALGIDQMQMLLAKDGTSVLLTVRRDRNMRYITLGLRKRL